MDIKRLRKKIVVEAGILAGVLVALAGFAYFLDSYSESLAQESRALEGETNGIMGQIASLREKYAKVKDSGELYKQVLEKKNRNELAIDRDVMKDRINQLRDQYSLNDMHLIIGPVQDLNNAKYKRASGSISSSDVSLTFTAMSDEYIYQVIDAMQQTLPGGSKIIRLAISKPQTITDPVLKTIRQKGTYSVIQGDIQFTWFGIKTTETDDAATKKP